MCSCRKKKGELYLIMVQLFVMSFLQKEAHIEENTKSEDIKSFQNNLLCIK